MVNPDSPDRRRDLANTDVVTLEPNDILRIHGAGGGGWGDPLARDPAAVLADVRRGRISEQAARDSYGVILRGDQLDPEATAASRRSRPQAAAGHFGFGEAREAYERIWTPANYAALTDVLGQVPVAWRFFVKHRIFAAIAALPPDRKAGDGSEVRAAFAAVTAEYPQLRATESSIG